MVSPRKSWHHNSNPAGWLQSPSVSGPALRPSPALFNHPEPNTYLLFNPVFMQKGSVLSRAHMKRLLCPRTQQALHVCRSKGAGHEVMRARPGVPSLILSLYREMDQGPPREGNAFSHRQGLTKPDQTRPRASAFQPPERSSTCWRHHGGCQEIGWLVRY